MHQVRDFGQTDEAFRIRSEDEQNRLTYKGPKIDRETKTRQELEIEFSPGADARRRMTVMLESLGFRENLTVIKRRRPYRLEWESREVHIVLDTVARLGEFVELETIASESEWQAARDLLQRLSAQLQLQSSERRSYLELLLEVVPSATDA
jgi:adenylate cyclase class 2